MERCDRCLCFVNLSPECELLLLEVGDASKFACNCELTPVEFKGCFVVDTLTVPLVALFIFDCEVSDCIRNGTWVTKFTLGAWRDGYENCKPFASAECALILEFGVKKDESWFVNDLLVE